LIHLRYRPRKPARKSVALVGKGITFDSGGLSLKPAASMETMKMDMSGAAAVLGVFHRISRHAPPVEVHGVIATTENMPGGRAYKPGDVLTALNGKTMEVLNTDAEGRLILADALAYAERQKPDAIVDLATLTGAVVIALGPLLVGLMSNDEALASRVRSAAEAEGESLWELPLVPEYRPDIKSKVADIKNIGGSREAGTIIGGLFLQEFVEKTPWVHLDIAGPAWLDRDFPSRPYLHPGGTGIMIRTLLRLLKGS
jgi:leucyl aminopeptidase